MERARARKQQAAGGRRRQRRSRPRLPPAACAFRAWHEPWQLLRGLRAAAAACSWAEERQAPAPPQPRPAPWQPLRAEELGKKFEYACRGKGWRWTPSASRARQPVRLRRCWLLSTMQPQTTMLVVGASTCSDHSCIRRAVTWPPSGFSPWTHDLRRHCRGCRLVHGVISKFSNSEDGCGLQPCKEASSPGLRPGAAGCGRSRRSRGEPDLLTVPGAG